MAGNGQGGLLAAAWTNPTDFVRNLMPCEMEMTATNVKLERMSGQQLYALIASLQAGLDPASEEGHSITS
jgi:hypothetical protein